jgi:hypothetical protein
MRPIGISIVAALTLLTGDMACGSSVPPPTDQWAAAQASVGRAQGSGAPYVPDANLHLQFATEDLQRCRQLMNKDNRRAEGACALANSEAELATSLARQASAQSEAMKAQTDLQNASGR